MTQSEIEQLRHALLDEVCIAVDRVAREARAVHLPHDAFLVRAVLAGFDVLIDRLLEGANIGEGDG